MRRVIAVNTLLLLVGLAGVELAFGSWLARTPALYHFSQPRNVSLRFESVLPGQPKEIVYTRDRYGLRGTYRALDGIFVLTVGGSTTDQRYVADGLTFQDRLAALFAGAGKPADIVNAGVDGQSTFGHLAAFDDWLERIPELKPRFVLFYVGINDFYNLGAREGVDRVKREGRFHLRELVEEKSALVALARAVQSLAQPAAIAHGMGEGVDNPARWPVTHARRLDNPWSPEVDQSLKRLVARIGELAQRTRGIGAEPIFVTQRSVFWRKQGGRIVGVYDWTPDQHSPALAKLGEMTGVDRYHLERLQADTILTACRAAKGVCIDLAGELDFDVGADFYDAFHTTPAGAERIARYLFDKLRSLR
jgi:lysophospholipase L1-like esterase